MRAPLTRESLMSPSSLRTMRRVSLLLILSVAVLAGAAAAIAAAAANDTAGGPGNGSARTADGPRAAAARTAEGPRAAAARARLTIRAVHNPATAGKRVVITGQLTGAGGRAVTLWQKLPGQRRYHAIARAALRRGYYRIARRSGLVTTNRRWFVAVGRVRSRAVLERVRVLITLRSSATSLATGQGVTLSGHVSPGHGGERVALQQRSGASWPTVARVRLDRRSNFAVS